MAANPSSSESSSLTAEELVFFRTYGYLIKRNAVPAERCERLLERMWRTAPPSVRRDDPETWRAVPAAESSDDALRYVREDRWLFRAASCEADMIETAYSPRVNAWAEQLLGRGTLQAPRVGGKPMGSWGPAWPDGPVDPALGEGVRGIYATLPARGAPPPPRLGMHTDGHPFHLGAVCLLDDTPPDSGAFAVWPGSHRRYYPLFPMAYDQARIPFYEHMPSHKGIIHPPEYLAEEAAVFADTAPVDCHGKQGDLVFWHHRLGHAAGHNRAMPPKIRFALLFDFSKTDLDLMRLEAPDRSNMWAHWSRRLQGAVSELSPSLLKAQGLAASNA